jgi:23S rRNA G2445 N2-methylase RlmL
MPIVVDGGERAWKVLLLLCQEQGKEKVLHDLEAQGREMERLRADFYAELGTVNQTNLLTRMINRQWITIGRLRLMTDEDIRQALESGREEATAE